MISARRITNLGCLFLLLSLSCVSTKTGPTAGKVSVGARQWSKSDGVVHYSDWKTFYATTLDDLRGYSPVIQPQQTLYGSDPSIKFTATGFFYTAKTGGRWWIVDPEGNATWNVAVNGVRPGSSARNEKSLSEKFGTNEGWISSTHREIESIGFNGTACWSEVPLVKYSNRHCTTPLCYTLILSLWSGYQKQARKDHTLETSFSVFDPAFASYVDIQAQKLTENRNDTALLGYFSDNELGFNTGILDEYLSVKNENSPGFIIAKNWIASQDVTRESISDLHREMFLGVVAEQYYRIVAEAIHRYDPNHLYLGSRLHGKPKHNEHIVKAAGKYCDILSINYYGQWEPSVKHFAEWQKWADKPIIITEFYVKGDDSGMPNMSGAGWRVKTQDERGVFYENFCMKLLQMKNCVGWHWFRYMDNDPTDTTADDSNNDSNKGIVNNFYEYYQPLTRHMRVLNENRYGLIRYFDR
jgi:hypothetical protein